MKYEKDREVAVWAEVFANKDVAKGLVKRNIRTGWWTFLTFYEKKWQLLIATLVDKAL